MHFFFVFARPARIDRPAEPDKKTSYKSFDNLSSCYDKSRFQYFAPRGREIGRKTILTRLRVAVSPPEIFDCTDFINDINEKR